MITKEWLIKEIKRQLKTKAEITCVGEPYVILNGEEVLAHLDAREVEVEKLKRQFEVAKDALVCISSKDKPRHEQEEYWIKLSHERCATVIATDTKIARQTLQEIEKIGREE